MKRALTKLLRMIAIITDYVRLRAALVRAMRHPGNTAFCCSERQGVCYSLTASMDMVAVRQSDLNHNMRRSQFIPAERVGRYLWRSVQ